MAGRAIEAIAAVAQKLGAEAERILVRRRPLR
jgi:hypothetical protein